MVTLGIVLCDVLIVGGLVVAVWAAVVGLNAAGGEHIDEQVTHRGCGQDPADCPWSQTARVTLHVPECMCAGGTK
jgi:hypothetical protein